MISARESTFTLLFITRAYTRNLPVIDCTPVTERQPLVSQPEIGGSKRLHLLAPVAPKPVQEFSMVSYKTSTNSADENKEFPAKPVKVIVYGLPPEDVASYRSKMYHLIGVRCSIFQRMPVHPIFIRFTRHFLST